jgi:hypothetical protein
MDDFNKQLLDEIDFARTNPSRYSKKLSKYIDNFKGNTLINPKTNVAIATEEGPDGYRDAIGYLTKQERREALNPSRGLCRAALDLLYEAKKDPDNVGSIRVEKLINKYGVIKGSLSRLIDFGGETPEEVVVNLIVSDGDPSKGQRYSMYNKDVKKIGVANSEDQNFGHITIIITATEFENKYDESDYGVLLTEGGVYVPQESGEDLRDDDEYEEGVVKVDKQESIINENGKKKKITKIIKTMEDGRKKIETIKEDLVE